MQPARKAFEPLAQRVISLAAILTAAGAVALIFFWSVLIQQTQTFLAFRDASIQSYAWNTAVFKAARHFTIKLWDFTTSSGQSFIGEMQTAALYPINWLFAWLGAPQNPELLEWKIAFHFVLCSVFAYAFIRFNGLSRAASTAGALVFTYVGSIALRARDQPNIFEGLVYLPAVLYLLQRAFVCEKPLVRNPWFLYAGVALAFMILAGHMQPAVHCGLAAFLLGAWWGGLSLKRWKRVMLVLALTVVVCALIALPQLIATIEYMGHVYRWVGLEKPTRPPHRIPYSAYGFLYVLRPEDLRGLFDGHYPARDASTLFFSYVGLGLAVIACLRRVHLFWFAIGLGFLAGAIAMGNGSILGQISYHLPLLANIREPIRILCLYHLAAACLVAIGFEEICERLRTSQIAMRGAQLLILGVMLYELRAEAAALPRRRSARFSPYNLYHQSDVTSFVDQTVSSRTHPPSRFCTIPVDLLPQNWGNVSGALSLRGHRATMLMAYFDYLSRDWNPTGESFRRLGLRYVVSTKPLENLRLVKQVGQYWFYERPNPLSIFYFWNSGQPVTEGIGGVEWGENSIRVDLLPIHLGGQLIFAQPIYPGWIARVDGKPVTLAHNDIFMAVEVQSDSREVSFCYRPKWLIPSLTLSALTMLAVVIAAFIHVQCLGRNHDGIGMWKERMSVGMND